MNSRTFYIILVFVFIIIFVYVLWHYFVNIYEVKYDVSPGELYADNNSTVKIEAVPLNSMGNRALFRKSPADFEFIEGKDLIQVVSNDSANGVIIIKSKNITGKVIIKVKAKFSLLPTLIEIPVMGNTAKK